VEVGENKRVKIMREEYNRKIRMEKKIEEDEHGCITSLMRETVLAYLHSVLFMKCGGNEQKKWELSHLKCIEKMLFESSYVCLHPVEVLEDKIINLVHHWQSKDNHCTCREDMLTYLSLTSSKDRSNRRSEALYCWEKNCSSPVVEQWNKEEQKKQKKKCIRDFQKEASMILTGRDDNNKTDRSNENHLIRCKECGQKAVTFSTRITSGGDENHTTQFDCSACKFSYTER
jgi:DNA-directed RNA polymerase subunit M/transcription elongation factor TFIIS